jgi:hypothetical protein
VVQVCLFLTPQEGVGAISAIGEVGGGCHPEAADAAKRQWACIAPQWVVSKRLRLPDRDPTAWLVSPAKHQPSVIVAVSVTVAVRLLLREEEAVASPTD